MKVAERLGLKDTSYGYLINEYIPDQGHDDMCMFISLGFNPPAYLMWKCIGLGLVRQELVVAVKAKFEKEYGVII